MAKSVTEEKKASYRKYLENKTLERFIKYEEKQ
jgi:hypothetical protein